MCGIVGCAGNLFDGDSKAFRDMLLFDTVRGQDSTGIVRVPSVNTIEPDVTKEVGAPQNLWAYKGAADWLDDRGVVKYQARALIGHNRAATIGEVTKENAHPFVFDGIYGVHNGSLWFYEDLEGDHDVDSKAIYNTIATKGVDHCWENLDGAAALVWWDNNTQRLNFVRNSQRPLYICETGRQSIYWASESWMINVAMSRQKVPQKKDKKDEKTYYPKLLKVDTLYSYSLQVNGYNLEEERKLTAKKLGTGYTAKAGFRRSFSQWGGHKEKRGDTTALGSSWASGLIKAGKEYRGLYAVSDYPIKVKSGNSWDYYIVCKLFNKKGEPVGSRVEVWPRTIAIYNKLRAEHDNHTFKHPLVFKIGCRPRIKTEGGKDCLRLSDQYAKLVSENDIIYKRIENFRSGAKVNDNKNKPYNVINMNDKKEEKADSGDFVKGYGGVMVPRWEFEDQLSAAGQCCAYCGHIVDADDADEIFWSNRNTILCFGCSNDQFVHELIQK